MAESLSQHEVDYLVDGFLSGGAVPDPCPKCLQATKRVHFTGSGRVGIKVTTRHGKTAYRGAAVGGTVICLECGARW